MKIKSTLILLNVLFSVMVFAQQGNRYTDSLFTSVQTDLNRVYATAPELNSPYTGESFTHNVSLKMHIFQPQDDALQKRPVLICAHGGGFVSGVKEHDDMMAFCEMFAEKGYVTATMDYRLGMNYLSAISGERAVYRGLQDSRAAIRFVKDIAAELKVDTTNIFFLGSSAGAFIALHNVFMNSENERPLSTMAISSFPPSTDNGPDLGGFDAVAEEYKHGGQPKAIISLWGALKDTILIASSDSTISVLLVHGTSDVIVPFGVGSPFSAPLLPPTYGSLPISQRLTNLSFAHDAYFVEGEGHEFYGVVNGNWSPAPNVYWDSVAVRTTMFLYQQHKPKADFSYIVNGSEVQFNDIGSDDVTFWYWEFGDGETSQLSDPSHAYAANGNYIVQLKVLNEIHSWDTLSTVINISATYVEDKSQKIPKIYSLSQNYPNPFNPETTIWFDVKEPCRVVLKVYNLVGQEVADLVNEDYPSGRYEADFNATGFSSGIYFYKIQMGDFQTVKKMVVLE
jgi:predicted esterase